MDPITAGAVIGAGSGLASGLVSAWSGRRAGDKNAAMQREFAQNGVTWRVEDAQRAGIHPLYALGAQTHSPSPSYVGGGDYGVGEMGQNISRAVSATMSPEERVMRDLQMLKLRSEIKETDARAGYYNSQAMQARNVGPPVPKDWVVPKGAEVFSTASESPALKAGVNPMFERRDVGGGWHLDMPDSGGGGISESLEGMGALGLALMRNLGYTLPKQVVDRPTGRKIIRRFLRR